MQLHFERINLVRVCIWLTESLKSRLLMLTHVFRIKLLYFRRNILLVSSIDVFLITIYSAHSNLSNSFCLFGWLWVRMYSGLRHIRFSSTGVNLLIKSDLELDQLFLHLLEHFVISRSLLCIFHLSFKISNDRFQILRFLLHLDYRLFKCLFALWPFHLFSFPIFDSCL